MSVATRLVLLVSVALVSPGAAVAQPAPLKDLPGMGKSRKGGYTITVEGGEDGPQTVHYSGEETPGARRPVAPGPLKGPLPAPVPMREASRTSGAFPDPPARPKGSLEKRIEEEGEIESPISRMTRREEELSGRRFGKRDSGRFGTDEKYDSRDPLAYGRWSGAGEAFEKRRSDGPATSELFETRQVEKKRVFYGTREHEISSHAGEKAEVPGWTERFARDKNDRFSDRGSGSALRDRMTEGYKTLTQVSMQDINRYHFRRSHSEVKGELPVGKAGSTVVSPMRPAE